MKYLLILVLFLSTIQSSGQDKINIKTNSKTKQIIVYGSDTCHYCIDTKTFLQSKNIEFTYYDIDVNKVKEQEMLVKLKKANIPVYTLSLPVIDNKGDVFLNEGDFKEFLKLLHKKIEMK